MARKILLVCDLGSEEHEAKETVTFGIDGASFELDVCTDHAAYLRETLGEFTDRGRMLPVPAGRRSAPQKERVPGTVEPPQEAKRRRKGIGDFNRDRQLAPDWSGNGRAPAVVMEAFDREFPDGLYQPTS